MQQQQQTVLQHLVDIQNSIYGNIPQVCTIPDIVT